MVSCSANLRTPHGAAEYDTFEDACRALEAMGETVSVASYVADNGDFRVFTARAVPGTVGHEAGAIYRINGVYSAYGCAPSRLIRRA